MTLKSVNPHDQSVVGELPVATLKDVAETVRKAKLAGQLWENVPIEERIIYIRRYKDLVVEHKEELAKLTTLEMGKPLQQSREDIDAEISFLNYYADHAPEFLSGENVYRSDSENFSVTYEPYGVCACIAPWNFPLSMANSGIIPALLAGNSVILKPSEYTSLSQKMVIDLLNQTGLPEGVANLLIGTGEIGAALVDADIDLVWFTGSTKVGQQIFEKASKKFIKALLEMGGSSPGIVFAGANLEHSLDQLYWARFLNCGQVCTSIKRLFVERPVYDQVVNMFVDKLSSLTVGNPLENVDVGPLVSAKQLQALEAQVADALDKGAVAAIGGKRPEDTALSKGNYFLPTILTNVSLDMKVVTQEVFGPVLPIIPFDTEQEAVTLANQTEYGLSAEIYTTDLEKGERVAKQIAAGTVAINTDNFFKPECPFGGFKKSGMGREYGEIGMKEFSQVKVIAKQIVKASL